MADQQTLQAPAALDAALAERIAAAMARLRIPGAAVGVLRDGVREEQGFGVVSLETGYPVRADSLFQIGSITKLFTATMVMLLVEAGQLALDRPVTDYLPGFRLADIEAQARVTIRMLLSHTGGFFGDLFDDTGVGDDALSRYLALLPKTPQQTPPGASWAYNNAGFVVAGALIERLTHLPYERAVRERIFQPLGMTRSFFFAHEVIAYPNAVGHTLKTPGADEHDVARNYSLPRSIHAAGGVISTVDDLLTFAQFQLDGGVARDGQRLLSEATLRSMWAPQIRAANFAESYGLGWETGALGGERYIAHGGSTNGFKAHLVIVPARRFAMVHLTNSGRGDLLYHEIENATLTQWLGMPRPKRQPIALAPERVAGFAGVYRQPDEIVTLTAHGDSLRCVIRSDDPFQGKRVEHPPVELRPLSETEFVCVTPGDNDGAEVDFLLDDAGRPRYLRKHGRLAVRTDEDAGERVQE